MLQPGDRSRPLPPPHRSTRSGDDGLRSKSSSFNLSYAAASSARAIALRARGPIRAAARRRIFSSEEDDAKGDSYVASDRSSKDVFSGSRRHNRRGRGAVAEKARSAACHCAFAHL